LSVLAHLVVLALTLVFWRAARVRILPEKYNTVEIISGPAYRSSKATSSTSTRPRIPSPVHRSARQARLPESGSAVNAAAAQALRGQAEQATAAIMANLKFRHIYGFSPNHDYQLAVRTVGEVPSISAADLPPHFQQYVMVEITIDTNGRVAEARIVAGMVDPAIERTLLSAIREFKYSPAKRDGAPIPSQLEIVIRIPS